MPAHFVSDAFHTVSKPSFLTDAEKLLLSTLYVADI